MRFNNDDYLKAFPRNNRSTSNINDDMVGNVLDTEDQDPEDEDPEGGDPDGNE